MNRNERDADHELLMRFKRAVRRYERTFIGKRYVIRIIGVLRTDEEQRALWWQSREKINGKIVQKRDYLGIPVPHVTYMDGTINRSKHQMNNAGKSEAIDFVPVNKKTGKIDWLKLVPFYVFGICCEKEGLFWGGRFPGFRDMGHVEIIKL